MWLQLLKIVASLCALLLGASKSARAQGLAHEEVNHQPASSTLIQPEWRIGLQEAIWMALQESELVRTLDRGQVEVLPTTTFDPAIAAQEVAAASATFDPALTTSAFGSWINKPPSAFYGPGIQTQTEWQQLDFVAKVGKTWATGASTSIGYAPPLAYLHFPTGTSNTYNPTYSSDFLLEVRQPLLRGTGRTVNEAPIRIARARHDQSLHAVAEATLHEVRSVIEAYWQLQASGTAVRSIEAMVPLALESVRLEEHRLSVERNIAADVARARVQLELLQQDLTRSRLTMQQRRLELGNLLGVPPVESMALHASDEPQPAPLAIDLPHSIAVATVRRPDLMRRRLELQILSDNLLVSRNELQPQLDLAALYRTSGLGDRWDDSMKQAGEFGYNDWTVGLTFSIPIGNRQARANLRSAELLLARQRRLLSEAERQVAFELSGLAAEAQAAWDEWQSACRQQNEAQEWLRVARIRYTLPTEAEFDDDGALLALLNYQEAMFATVNATRAAASLLARYNAILARLSAAQGVLLDEHGVHWAEEIPEPSAIETAPEYLTPVGGHSVF